MSIPSLQNYSNSVHDATLLQLTLENLIRVQNGVVPITEPLLTASNHEPNEVGIIELPMQILKHPIDSCYMIVCRVCLLPIEVSNDEEGFIVKCSYCYEATPIRFAPEGKKYLRCSCHCLLVCNESSHTVRCPRTNCGQVITVRINQPNWSSYMSGKYQVFCAHCREVFLFNTLPNALARCRNCQAVSVRQSAERGTLYQLIFGVLCLIAVITLLVSGEITDRPILVILYFLLFAINFFVIVKSIRYYRLKMSYIENEPEPAYQTI